MGCFEVLLKVGVRDDHCDVTKRSKIKSTTLRQTQPRWLKTAIGPLTVKSILMNRKDNFNSVCSFRATAKCRPFRWTLNNVQTLCRVHHPLYFGALMFGDEHRQTSLLGFPSEQTFVNSLICKEPTKVIARNPLLLRTTANRSNPPPHFRTTTPPDKPHLEFHGVYQLPALIALIAACVIEVAQRTCSFDEPERKNIYGFCVKELQ